MVWVLLYLWMLRSDPGRIARRPQALQQIYQLIDKGVYPVPQLCPTCMVGTLPSPKQISMGTHSDNRWVDPLGVSTVAAVMRALPAWIITVRISRVFLNSCH